MKSFEVTHLSISVSKKLGCQPLQVFLQLFQVFSKSVNSKVIKKESKTALDGLVGEMLYFGNFYHTIQLSGSKM
jgi:hypothetical protein